MGAALSLAETCAAATECQPLLPWHCSPALAPPRHARHWLACGAGVGEAGVEPGRGFGELAQQPAVEEGRLPLEHLIQHLALALVLQAGDGRGRLGGCLGGVCQGLFLVG